MTERPKTVHQSTAILVYTKKYDLSTNEQKFKGKDVEGGRGRGGKQKEKGHLRCLATCGKRHLVSAMQQGSQQMEESRNLLSA